MNSLVSVIVPIENVESYISVCVESIIKQTYNNLEVILACKELNDNSMKICKYYEKKDKRVKVIKVSIDKEENLKSIGLSKAKGKYVTFVDGGDTITKNFIEYMVELIDKEKADLVSAKYYIKGKRQRKITYYEVYDKNEIMPNYMHMKFKSTLCSKLFKKDLFDEINFPDETYFDDFLLGYRLFDKANKMVNSNLEVYLLNKDKDKQIIRDYDRMKKIGGCFDMLTFIEERYPDLVNYCKTKVCFEAIDLFRSVKDKDYSKQIYSYIKLYRKYALHDERIDISKKMLCMRSILGYHIMKLSFNLEELLKKPIN